MDAQARRETPDGPLLNGATVAAAVAAALIFTLDLVLPLGAGIATLYVLPLLLGTLAGPPRFQPVAASVLSLLTVAGGVLAPPEALGAPYAWTNRALALLVIWTTAIVLGRFRRTWLDLRARTLDLQART